MAGGLGRPLPYLHPKPEPSAPREADKESGSALMGNQIGGPQRQPPTKPTWLGRAFPFQDTCSEELPSCPVVRPHSCHCQGHEFSP